MRILTRSLGGTTLLDYQVTTTPFPLQASPADTTQPLTSAALTVIASNQNNHNAAISQIQISFDIAPDSDPDDATYLTSVGAGMTFQVLGDPEQQVWTLSNDGAGTFTAIAVAKGGVVFSDQGVALVISGIQPNRSVGSFQLTVTETPAAGSPNGQAIELSKFPPAFFLSNFRSDAPSVGQGLSTTLRWDASSGAVLTIIWEGGQQVVTGVSSWPTPALTGDTAFMLQASIGDFAVATLSLSVQVVQPILDLTSLTVEQGSTLKGAVGLGATLGVAGDATLSGVLNVAGAAALGAGATVTGDVAATGAVSGASVTASGAVAAASVVAPTLTIGPWTLSLDANGNLLFSNAGGASTLFLSGGGMTFNGEAAIASGYTVWIANDQGWLNGSSKIDGGGADGWNATSYWQGGPPDGDSQLVIQTTYPG